MMVIGIFYQILFVVALQQFLLACPFVNNNKNRKGFAIDDRLLPYFDNMTPFIGCELNKYNQIERFVRFYHYTRMNPLKPQEIVVNNHKTLKNWIHGAPVRILIHGFVDSKDLFFIPHVKRAYLEYRNFNIIAVDWSLISQSLCYRICARKADLIGKYIAKFIQFLRYSIARIKLSDIHVIGHSLGAHIAGSAGKYLKPYKIPVIYGLDPAGPLYRKQNADLRLDPTDAEYVEVIHTDGKDGFGIDIPVGHVDFYVNGANNQPSCIKNLMSKLFSDVWLIALPEWVTQLLNICSHLRAYEIFSESLRITFKYGGTNLENIKGFYGIKCHCAEQALNKMCRFDPRIPLRKITTRPNTTMYGIYHVTTSSSGPNFALGRQRY